MARPDYIKRIRHTHTDKRHTSWCGRELASCEFTFTEIDHAAYAAMQGAMNIPCQKCVKEIVRMLRLKGKPSGG